MKVLTIKSMKVLDEDMQTEVHYTLGMEHYTDYVFKPRGDEKYSATIVLENTETVIQSLISSSASIPGVSFVIEDLDMDSNKLVSYHVLEGLATEQ